MTPQIIAEAGRWLTDYAKGRAWVQSVALPNVRLVRVRARGGWVSVGDAVRHEWSGEWYGKVCYAYPVDYSDSYPWW